MRPPVVATDVIGHYSQYLAWLQDLRRSVPANGPTPTLGRTMRIEADGTVTIVDDANGEVRAHGTWTVESDTVVLTMAEGTLLGTLQGKELTVSVRSAEMQHATTWHRKK